MPGIILLFIWATQVHWTEQEYFFHWQPRSLWWKDLCYDIWMMPLCTWMCKYPRPFLLFFWIYIPRNEIAGSCGSSPEKAMTTYSSILAWRIPWTEEPVYGYSPWRCRESDTTKQLLLSLFMEILLLNHMTKIEFHMNCMNHILGFFFLKWALIFWKLRSSKMLGTLFGFYSEGPTY